MENLRIFDEERNAIGVADRYEVHKKGYWHETFHCWFVKKIKGIDYIYFQKRCYEKQDFPNLLDITAAGHLLSHESVEDGVREVKEEIGVEVQMEDLIALGVIENCIVSKTFKDREFSHVFLYLMKGTDEFHLQIEEVSGMYKAAFPRFFELCTGVVEEIEVEGFEMEDNGTGNSYQKKVCLEAFVPHQRGYLENVAMAIKNQLR